MISDAQPRPHAPLNARARVSQVALQPFLAAGLLVISGHAAWSGTTPYFDRRSFDTACSALPGVKQQIRFSDFLYSAWFDHFPPEPNLQSITISGVTFQGRCLALYFGGGNEGFLYGFDGGIMRIHFDRGARAFAADFSSALAPFYSSFTATVTVDGQVFSFPAPASPGSVFFGFVSTGSVTNVTFDDGERPAFPLQGLHEELIGDPIMVLNEIPSPSLTIRTTPSDPNNVYLQWPAGSPGFYLLQNEHPSTTNWALVPQAPQIWPGTTNLQVTLPKPAGAVFYRLILDASSLY